MCCAALCAGGSSCPAAVLLGSPSVWQVANHSAGKQCHFSSVCQNEQGREEIQRCKEDERREAWGGSRLGREGREEEKMEMGGGRRRKGRERQTALHPHLRIEQQPAPFPQSCTRRQSIPAAASGVQGKNQRLYLHADESQPPLHLSATRGKMNLAFPVFTPFVTCHFPE